MNVTSNDTLQLDDCGAADLGLLMGLTRHVGWPHTDGDWRDYLAAAEVFGHREAAGGLASCAALCRFGPELASVGLVIVHQRYRGAGLARALMQRCVDTAGAHCLTLVATPLGLPLYERIGFARVGAVAKHIGEPRRDRLVAAARSASAAGAAAAVTLIVQGALDAYTLTEITALDRVANGTSRHRMLAEMSARSGCTLAARDANGGLCGFAFAMPKTPFMQIAPLIARDDATALELIAAAAANIAGPMRIDVPLQQSAVIAALAEAQWPRISDDPVLTLHGVPLPGKRSLLRAISFQAWG